MDIATLITEDFWKKIAENAIRWAVGAVPSILLVLVLGAVLSRLLSFGCRQLARRLTAEGDDPTDREDAKRTQTLVELLRRMGSIAILMLTLLLVLTQVGINLAPLLASAGVLGLAIGFGAQELVKDFFFGFFLLLEGHIRLGDVAVVNGTGGVVEKIGLRTTVLRDLSGALHVFRNGSIATLANSTKNWSASVFDIGVAYKEDTDEVADVMKKVAAELQADPDFAAKILQPLEVFGVDSFGDSAIVVKARIKTRPMEQWTVGREYRRRLKRAFDQHGIEIPFPHRTLYWGQQPAGLKPTQAEAASQGGGRAEPV